MSNDADDASSPDDAFRTQRMQTLSGLSPAFVPGEFVFLQHPMPGFADGTRFKVVAAQGIAPGKYRYELLADEKIIWVAESDVRSTRPESGAPAEAGRDALADSGPNRALSMTQRMQTMTLSQRMDLLGIVGGAEDAGDPLAPDGHPPVASPLTNQRMRGLTPEQRLRNDAASPAPDPDDPITGAPFEPPK